ncbi:pentatricopeptide repeat-containing protein At3g09040, mitochondrial [Spinacia oleracea]|uniref:Pentatricopeptide repeat-containing protein At3g09040, mitochondrial n=1 Tax=Spinacia oleracea TaxID=3562 RepID=A0A9R0I5J6_SPIOL|nr:pentatricopeptide repeat-containing protein At3g09040, mitochondrial-like [Spinacia oleracea]
MQFIKQLSNPQNIGSLLKLSNKRKICAFFRRLHLDSCYKTDTSDLIFSNNRAIDDHIKSGSLDYAHQLFDEMSVRDVVSWNLLISGYKRYGLPGKAFELYSEMLSQGFAESPSTFSCVMSICSNNGFYFEGIQVHSRVISLGFCGNLYIGSSIVDLYVQMGFVDDGLKVLNEMPERNVAVWNLVFRGFCKLGMWDEIIRCFPRVKFDGVMLNGLMVCYLLQGCCNGNFVIQGEQLHCLALKAGLVESDRFVANALVDFYSACGTLSDASKSFEIIPYDAVISWNSIVSAYANSGVLSDALEHFVRMHYWSMKPSVRSFVALLNSCSKSENLFLGTQLHCFVLKLGFDCGSIHVQSALIDMYGKCYEIESSFNIYEECTCKTMECCNALLTSMLHCSYAEEVVELFKFMGYEGIRFDEFSLSTTLKALSGSSYMSLSSCTLLHSLAIKIGFESHNVVSCSLIDTYSKLGQVDHSRGVFEGLCSPNVVSFTSIVNGYACNGLGKECLKLLEVMFQKGLKPDRVTFLCVLTGCNHSGLVEEGRRVFESMKSLHGIEPDPRHYSCMVDLLGRAGLVCEAEELLKLSLIRDSSLMWSSLLRSCRIHKNVVVGQRVAKRLVELEPGNSGVCLQVSNFYLEVGDSELSMHYRDIWIARQSGREIGHSFIV